MAIWLVGGSEKPPHDQAPVFNTYKGLSTSHLSKKRRIRRHHFLTPSNEAEGMPFLRVSGTQMLISMGKMVFLALFIEFLLTNGWKMAEKANIRP